MDSKKLVTRVSAKSFVKIACLIVPDLPMASTGILVTLNGQTVAAYPGTIRKFPSRKSQRVISDTLDVASEGRSTRVLG